MPLSTLEAIIQKIRRLTSSPNNSQLTDAMIIDYINSFYLFDFPAEYRTEDLIDFYTFNTIEGIDTYPFDFDHYTSVQEPCYIAKREIRLFTQPLQFYWFNFNSANHWQKQETIGTGDGVETNFTGTLQNSPFLRSINNNPMVTTQTSSTSPFPSGYPPTFPNSNISRIQNILITANIENGTTLNVTDDGNGNLIGDVNILGTNSIDYSTGDFDVTFSSPPGDDDNVIVLYNPMILNMPLAIMFYQNQLILRPVPDKGYTVELTAYRLPSQVLLGTDSTTSPNLNGRPEMREWWETIAVGASKKIYEDRLDMEGVAMMDKILQERYAANYTRTYGRFGSKRIATIYSDQLEFRNGTGPFGLGNYS